MRTEAEPLARPWYKLRDNPVPTDKATLDAIPEPIKQIARRLYKEHRYEKPRDVYGTKIVGELSLDTIYEATKEQDDEAFWQVLALLDNHGFYCHP